MKNKLFMLLCSAMIVLSGCAQSDNSSIRMADSSSKADQSSIDDGAVVSSDDRELGFLSMHPEPLAFEERYASYQKAYPDKTILVWLSEFPVKYEKGLNDHLYKNGYDYVVCSKNINHYDGSNEPRAQTMKRIIEGGEQIDILESLSRMYGLDTMSNPYYYQAEQEYLEELDERLKDERYSEYYNSLPQKFWDSYKYNGHIYGIDNSFSTLYPDSGYFIDKDALEKAGVTPEELAKSPAEISDVLKKINKATGQKMDYYLAFFTDSFYPAENITIGIAIKDGKAINVFETQEALDFYTSVNKLKDDGIAFIDFGGDTKSGIIDERGSYGIVVDDKLLNRVKVFYRQNNFLRTPTFTIGVCKNSKNKDMAFDFLMHYMFDKEINNIITYGEKDKDYQIEEDGSVRIPVNSEGNMFEPDTVHNNPMISLPCYNTLVEIYPRDFYSLYESAEVLDGVGFLFDATPVADKYHAVQNEIQKFSCSATDVKDKLDRFNQKLRDAGLDDVLEEINKQLEAFYEK